MADARKLAYVLRMEDETQEALGSMEGGLARIHSGFLGIPTIAAAAAIGIVSVGEAAEEVAKSILEAAKESVEFGIEWQHTVSNLAAAADISIEKAHEMGAAFQALGSDVPQSGQEITEAYEKVAGRLELFTGQAQSAANAAELMKTAAEGAVAGNQHLEAATNALVQQMLASHSSIEEQAHVMDVLFNTSRLTGTGYEELSTIMGRLQARMGEAAPPIQDVGLAIAIMTEAGLTGSRAMMVVTQMMNALAEPSEKAQQDLEGLGAQIEKNADGSLNLRGTLEGLAEAFRDINDPVTRHALAVELVGKEYAGVFESALRAAAGRLDELSEKVDKADSAQEAAAKHAGDLREMVEKLGNQIRATAQLIGGEFAADLVNFGRLFDLAGSSAEIFWRQISRGTGPLATLRQNIVDFGTAIDNLPGAAKVALGLIPGVGEALDVTKNLGLHFSEQDKEAELARIEEANKAWENAHRMIPPEGTTSQQEAGPERAPFDTAAIQANAEAMRSLGAEGQKVHNILLDLQKAALPSDVFAGLNELSAAETRQAEMWARAFDPAHPEIAAQRVAELARLTEEFARARTENDQAGMTAAAAALDALNRRVVAEEDAATREQKIAAFNKQQADEAQRQEEARLRAIHEQALTGFDEGTVRNELIQKWGKLGSDSIVALTEALADPAHMRSAGESLSNSIAQLTEHLHDAGVEDWQATGAALTAAFRQALTDGTPESVQAAQDLLSETVAGLSATEMWAEWEKAARAAGDKVNIATIETADKIEAAWQEHQTAMQQLDERFSEKDRLERARAAVDSYVADLKVQNDAAAESQKQADQDIVESMRLVDQQRDSSLQQARQAADAATNQLRSQRDATIQEGRAAADAAAEHQQRLADIAAKGGPDAGAQTAAENQSFSRQEARAALQRQRADADRRQAGQDAAVDLATRITREQADRSRHEADALALKAREHDLATQEQADAVTRAEDLRKAKQDKEEQFHIDKAFLDAAEKARQIADIDDRYRHEADKENEHLAQVEAAGQRELQLADELLQKKYPTLTSPLNLTAPPAAPNLTVPFLPGFFPAGAGAGATGAGSMLNIGTLNVTNNGYMGEGGPEALAAEMVAAEEALIQ